MLLAGDIGGTNTRLGLFERQADRPRPTASAVFPTLAYRGLPGIISAFADGQRITGADVDGACFGVAGPVVGEAAELTNVPWRVDAGEIATVFGIRRVALLNDLQAMAHAVPVLRPGELLVLQQGAEGSLSGPSAARATRQAGNMALVAAGTGLGETILHHVDGRYVPVASEGGHADFAARTEREIDLLRDLLRRFGHAEIEQVVSGMGLVNLYRVTHEDPCAAAAGGDPAAITTAALERRCRWCVEALDMFVDAYGAEAGNLALRSMATAGVFVGGGIAPKILAALTDGRFIKAFLSKASPFRDMLAAIPVKVILNDEAGLLGAAVYAATL